VIFIRREYAMSKYRAVVTYPTTVNVVFIIDAADKGEAAEMTRMMTQEDTFEVQRTGFYHEARVIEDHWDVEPWNVQIRDIVEEEDDAN
jgi:hypothetical protein